MMTNGERIRNILGVAPGEGEGAIAPRRSILAPPSENEKRSFSEIFGLYSTRKTIL